MKSSITMMFLLFLLSNIVYAYYGTISYVAPMPMPGQYRNFDQYKEALQVWENVHINIVSRSTNTHLPPMPMPNQYRNLDQYRHALKVWERVGSAQGTHRTHVVTEEVIWLPPIPVPTQYRKLEYYQNALQIWVNVSKNLVTRSSNIRPLPMPMPTQYQKTEYYNSALQAWKEVFTYSQPIK